jgi:hypothetical protein
MKTYDRGWNILVYYDYDTLQNQILNVFLWIIYTDMNILICFSIPKKLTPSYVIYLSPAHDELLREFSLLTNNYKSYFLRITTFTNSFLSLLIIFMPIQSFKDHRKFTEITLVSSNRHVYTELKHTSNYSY